VALVIETIDVNDTSPSGSRAHRQKPDAIELARYLSEGRGIDLDRIGGVPECLRYQIDAVIPETEPQQYGFAMVAAVTDVC
jgi:hypothetical protein